MHPPLPQPQDRAAGYRNEVTGRRPRGFELISWVFMRISGALLVLLILGHLAVNLVVGGGINAIDFALVAGRYTNPFWQLWSLAILWLAMLHGANGMRTLIHDYTERPATRAAVTVTLYVTTATIITLGTLVIFSFDPCPARADPALVPSFCEAG